MHATLFVWREEDSISIGDIIVRDIASQQVASIRGTGTYDPTIGEFFKELATTVFNESNTKAGVKMAGPPIYICHDKEYKEKDADIEVAFPISGTLAFTGSRVSVKELPPIRAATLIYTGPYAGIKEAYDALFAYVGKEGLRIGGDIREVYISNPDEVAPEKLQTEIQMPII